VLTPIVDIAPCKDFSGFGNNSTVIDSHYFSSVHASVPIETEGCPPQILLVSKEMGIFEGRLSVVCF
jgi:hypothetical protein